MLSEHLSLADSVTNNNKGIVTNEEQIINTDFFKMIDQLALNMRPCTYSDYYSTSTNISNTSSRSQNTSLGIKLNIF